MNTTNMRFRKAVSNDLDHIMMLVKRAIAHMQELEIYQWDEIYPARADFEADLQKHTLYVGVVNEQIAAVFVLNETYDPEYMVAEWKYPDRPYNVLHRLCVDPKFQHQGIGGQTLQFVEKETKKMKKDAVRLDVFKYNPYAIRLYENCGFHMTGMAEWRMGPFYLMEKYLEE